MRALIGTHGKVISVRPNGKEFPAPNKWVDAPDDVKLGWSYDGKDFAAPPVVDDDIPLNVRNVFAELDDLKQRVAALERHGNASPTLQDRNVKRGG